MTGVVSDEDFFRLADSCPFTVSSCDREIECKLSGIFYKDTNPTGS